MFFAWMLLLAGTIPHDLTLREETCCIEHSHFYDDNGLHVFDQWIFWRWNGYRHEVQAWRLDKGQFAFQQRPPMLTWVEGDNVRQVKAKYWRETWEQFDPELLDREILPANQRKGLSGEKR